MEFKSFFLHPQLVANMTAAGYFTPTPIQARAIPKVMQGFDVMGLAQTGTGKTAAFVLPILHRLLQERRKGIRALIIAPTRELAEQINQAILMLGKKTGLRSVTVYGGVGILPQVKALKGADIVVACPGRLLDLIRRKIVNLFQVEVLVLDEADIMFDMGFMPDIRRIIAALPQSDRQTMLFSATMPFEISRLADKILNNRVDVEIGHEGPAETVSHTFFPVDQHQKAPLLLKLLGDTNMGPVLIFTRTKHRAKQLCGKLVNAGFRSASLQGNLSQSKRQDAMNGFKSGKYQVLVATDIASRGIDVSNISHVINYDMPSTAEIYIHRIGRTGRAECNGEAYSLITGEDRTMVNAVNRAVGMPVEKRILGDFDYKNPVLLARSENTHQNKTRKPVSRSDRRASRRKATGAFASA